MTPSLTSSLSADRIRPVARELVAQTFFLPMLKEARETPFTSETSRMLNGGTGGNAFRGMLEEIQARKLANGPGNSIAESIVNRLK
ncbi:MAG: rod-binding protein [Planctomycetota bacterium]